MVSKQRHNNPLDLNWTKLDNANKHYFRPLIHRPTTDLCVICGNPMGSNLHLVVPPTKIERV